ncbi:hypothetical protein K503DRAFT_859839 [Rhizopogon vinicolor AM-OR11-026]|uniref:Holliday junction resolvase Gen1 C-terminal domain-containing protein n=1 Tax=Rhizopogon vinicolor AM-OR11-026 TaxID=1314800 RepID=A0A1B7ML91_9AGAM|nr:hypothetical protein K503DRAFT_859839 [Rhizopogon vinicolor AM-OR11-026]
MSSMTLSLPSPVTRPKFVGPKDFVTRIFPHAGDPASTYNCTPILRNGSGTSRPSFEGRECGNRVLLTEVLGTRQHMSTDNLLEYRVEGCPSQLVELARSGIKETRPELAGKFTAFNDVVIEGSSRATKKTPKGLPPDPHSNMRVWIPISIVRQVHPGLVDQGFKEFRFQKSVRIVKAVMLNCNRKVVSKMSGFLFTMPNPDDHVELELEDTEDASEAPRSWLGLFNQAVGFSSGESSPTQNGDIRRQKQDIAEAALDHHYSEEFKLLGPCCTRTKEAELSSTFLTGERAGLGRR